MALVLCILRIGLGVALLGVVLVTLAIVSSAPAMAQSSGTTQITGIVGDAQRHPLDDAQVRLSGAVSKTATTGRDGSFAFLNLPSGTYRLDISKSGFNGASQE